MTADRRPGPHSNGRAPDPQHKVFAVLGPTNTGKTHYAVERMLGHESGMFGAPLRLLAREVYDRVVAMRGARSVALMTGEEKIVPESPSYWICTVEAMPVDRRVSFLAVDEIQLAQDPERGHTFTDRLLHARGSQETMFLGAGTMRGIIRELVPDIQFVNRSRLSQLSYAGPKKISRLPRRSAVVAFSADQVYGLAETLRSQRGGAAVVMGALSPRTRNAQVALYQSGEVDFIVATDAIGMGLNMDIDHVAFAARRKFDGHATRDLRANELGQIAGRAGRYMSDGTFGVTGECLPFENDLVDQIENHRFDPVRSVQWRSPDLDFSSVDALIASLEAPPAGKGLMRPRAAIDLIALKAMATIGEVAGKVTNPGLVQTLWSVCQIPDFQQTMIDNHVRLLTNVFVNLMDAGGHLPEDWIAGHVERLDNTDGDIDSLSTRIAHVRTWTFVSNRSGWLDRPEHWQERTREIEDKLSDALHERLTQAFIDRRTSHLMKRLHQSDELTAEVDDSGDVAVEGEYVGRLSGFQLLIDPRAGDTKGALEAKALRTAATRALDPHVRRAADRLACAPDMAFSLQDRGTILWEGAPVGRLEAGPDALSPRTDLVVNDMIGDLLGAEGRARLQNRLERWTRDHIRAGVAPLIALRDAVDSEGGIPADGPVPLGAERKPTLNGLARGIGYQLVEHLGTLPRHLAADQIKEIGNTERAELRALGIRFGEFSLFLPALLKPAAARLLVILWGVKSGRTASNEGLPVPPPPGLTSVPMDPAWTDPFLGATGYRRCGGRAVRIDILERIGNLIRKQRFPEPRKTETPATSPEPKPLATPEPGATQTISADAPATAAEPDVGAVEPAAQPDIVHDQTGDTLATETPAPAAMDAPAAPPPIPNGAFAITAEMLSLAGCSADDFGEILKGLRYRPQTEKLPDGTERTLWRAGRPRGPHQDRQPGARQRRGKGPPQSNRPDAVAEGAEGAPAKPRHQHRRRGAGKPDDANRPQNENRPPQEARPTEQEARKDHGGKRRGGGQSGDGKRFGKGADREPGQGKPHGGGQGQRTHQNQRPPRQQTMDPHSPFAVLAQLKETLKRP